MVISEPIILISENNTGLFMTAAVGTGIEITSGEALFNIEEANNA